MNTVGITSAILINVALFTVYYIGLGQDQPVNASPAASEIAPANPSRPASPSRVQSSLPPKESGAEKRATGDAGDRIKEVLDGKEVIDHKEVIDPKDVAPVGEFSELGGVPLQPQLPNTEFRPASRHRKLGISSAPNPANLQPPVVSPESR